MNVQEIRIEAFIEIIFYFFPFFVVVITSLIVIAPMMPKILLLGFQSKYIDVIYAMSAYVGGIGLGLLFAGSASLLGSLFVIIFWRRSEPSIFQSRKADLIAAVISTILGFVLLGWYMCSYLYS